jgi:hypothetical protein
LPSARGAVTTFGADDNPSFSIPDALDSQTVKIAAAAAATYHGYRRTGSLVWALIYGVAARFAPVATTAVSLAQGYGQKKPCP